MVVLVIVGVATTTFYKAAGLINEQKLRLIADKPMVSIVSR